LPAHVALCIEAAGAPVDGNAQVEWETFPIWIASTLTAFVMERYALHSRIVGAKGAIGLLSVALNFGRDTMAWNKPVITEVCVAMEINGYMPIEF
jgi:coenzyme PQQ precursor peptide PqqA